jgi:hypothetical protein
MFLQPKGYAPGRQSEACLASWEYQDAHGPLWLNRALTRLPIQRDSSRAMRSRYLSD